MRRAIVVVAPNHDCDRPEVGEDAAQALGERGRVYWRCPVCRSSWKGVPHEVDVSWDRIEDSRWRWRRGEAKRILALIYRQEDQI